MLVQDDAMKVASLASGIWLCKGQRETCFVGLVLLFVASPSFCDADQLIGDDREKSRFALDAVWPEINFSITMRARRGKPSGCSLWCDSESDAETSCGWLSSQDLT